MPTIIGIEYGSEDGNFSLAMVQEIIVNKSKLKLTYLVLSDNVSQTSVDIKATSGLPVLGLPLYGMLCHDIDPRNTDTVVHPVTGALCCLWKVDVTFDTEIRPITDTTPKVSWSGELDGEHQEFDLLTQEKITTTAGEPIFIERPVVHQILRVRRAEAYPWNDMIGLLYGGRTNSQPFWNRPVGTALMLPIEVEEDTLNNQRMVWVTYQIKFRYMWDYKGDLMENSWQARPLNQGYMVRPTAGAKPVIGREVRGNPMKVNLARDGTELKNSSGDDLHVHSSAVGSLNPAKGVFDGSGASGHPVEPVQDDVGGTMIISSGAGFNPGEYTVIAVDMIGGLGPYWILDGDPGSDGSSGGAWELQRCPIYLYFNRTIYADFNALSIGPF